MALMTPTLKKRFVEIGRQSLEKDPTVVAKLHDPFTETEWFVIEYTIETESCYGFKVGVNEMEGKGAWDTFSIKALETMNNQVKLDMDFEECLFSEVAPEWYLIENDISLPGGFIDYRDYPEYQELQYRLEEIDDMRRGQEVDKLGDWER